jgi:hypothetical protein
VGGQPALIMPYFQTCNEKELQNNTEYRLAAMEALKLMVQKHGDLATTTCHVGLYKKVDKVHAVLIDLSHVDSVKTDNLILRNDEEAPFVRCLN